MNHISEIGVVFVPMSPQDLALTDAEWRALDQLDHLGAGATPDEIAAILPRLPQHHETTEFVRGWLYSVRREGRHPPIGTTTAFQEGFWEGWCGSRDMGRRNMRRISKGKAAIAARRGN